MWGFTEIHALVIAKLKQSLRRWPIEPQDPSRRYGRIFCSESLPTQVNSERETQGEIWRPWEDDWHWNTNRFANYAPLARPEATPSAQQQLSREPVSTLGDSDDLDAEAPVVAIPETPEFTPPQKSLRRESVGRALRVRHLLNAPLRSQSVRASTRNRW